MVEKTELTGDPISIRKRLTNAYSEPSEANRKRRPARVSAHFFLLMRARGYVLQHQRPVPTETSVAPFNCGFPASGPVGSRSPIGVERTERSVQEGAMCCQGHAAGMTNTTGKTSVCYNLDRMGRDPGMPRNGPDGIFGRDKGQGTGRRL